MKFATSKPKTNLKKSRNIYFAIFQEGLLCLQMNLVSRFGAMVSHFYRPNSTRGEYSFYPTKSSIVNKSLIHGRSKTQPTNQNY